MADGDLMHHVFGVRRHMPGVCPLLTFAVLACLSCGRGHGDGFRPTRATEAEASGYDFLSSVLRSLATANDGIKEVQSAQSSKNLFDLMTANQHATIALHMAVDELRPFAITRDSTRLAAVDGLTAGYTLIENSLAIQMAGYERIDSAQTANDLRGLTRQASNGRVAFEQGAALLVEAAVLAFGSVIVPSGKDSSHVALNMTAGEQQRLVAAADSLFGVSLRTATSDASGPVGAASTLWKALSKGWRVAK